MKRILFKFHLLSLYLFAPLFLLQIYAQQSSPTKTLFVSVLDSKFDPVTTLSQSAFTVFEDKKAQVITSFGNTERSASIGILFDLSPSFIGEDGAGIDFVRNGLFEFIKSSNPSNDYFIMGFSDQTTLITDWTDDENKVTSGLNQLTALKTKCPKGKCSRVYDACFAAIEKLNTASHTKRVLLIITDSFDVGSKHSQKELTKLALQKDVLIYAAIVLGSGVLYLRPSPPGLKFIERLSKATGGYPSFLLNFPDPGSGWLPGAEIKERHSKVKESFRAMALTLRSQYEISYQPTDNNPGEKPYKIELGLTLSQDLKEQLGKYKLFYRSEYLH